MSKSRRAVTLTKTALAILVLMPLVGAGCGLRDGPTQADGTVSWRLEIASQAPFMVRVWLDGDAVYTATAAATRHLATVERPYRKGERLVEYEILSASVDPSTYGAAWSVEVKPSGPMFIADGVPTMLRVGQRLTIRVPL